MPRRCHEETQPEENVKLEDFLPPQEGDRRRDWYTRCATRKLSFLASLGKEKYD